jgi:hypothetical protein
MRQYLAGLYDNLVKMAQVFDWRAASIVKSDIAFFQHIGTCGRCHQNKWQYQR